MHTLLNSYQLQWCILPFLGYLEGNQVRLCRAMEPTQASLYILSKGLKKNNKYEYQIRTISHSDMLFTGHEHRLHIYKYTKFEVFMTTHMHVTT